MEKRFAFLLTGVVGVGGFGLVAVACSDTETSIFPGEGTDASTEAPPGFGSSSGNTSSSSGGSSGEGGVVVGAKCEPVIASDYKASWTAPAAPASPGPCTGTTVGTYYDECLDTLGDADHKTRCDAWKAANATCGACVEPTNNSGPIQWYRDRFYYTLNVAGCLAINQGNKFSDTQCGYAYGAAVNCARDACAGCFETGTSTFKNFTDCQNAAEGVGICKSLQTQQASVCTSVSTATDTKGCFNENNKEERRVHYTRVMSYFCAKP